MLSDQNLVYQDMCNHIAEYIQMRNKCQLELLRHNFYQEPNKQENLKLNNSNIF
jgi:hypothetical protein